MEIGPNLRNPPIYPQKRLGGWHGVLSRGEGALRKVVRIGGWGRDSGKPTGQ